MKYKNIAFIIIILSLWINPVNADSKVAPYADIPTQHSANWPENYMDAEFIQANNNDRIRQNGDISKIKFDVANTSNLMEFYFTIWRKNDNGGYDRIAITDNLNGDISDGINEIELRVPISGVQEGDYYGYRIKTSGPALYVDTSEVRLTYFVNNSASSINFDWESKEWRPYIFVIESFMNNPYMVFIGDSIISGNVAHYSFIENTDVTDIPSTIENHWSGKAGGMTYQNMGHGGQRTSDLDARFNSDVVELSSEFVLIEGGVNDVNCHRFTADEISNNLESMIQKAYSNKITPVIMLILPENDHSPEQDYGTDEDLAKIDEINNNLIEIAARYTPSIVVDARSYVGVERSSGPDGNLWDINPDYNSGDGIHFNSAGHERIAQTIKDSFKYIYGKPGLYNLIQSDGTIIYSEGLSNATNTSWRMASTSSTANVIYNEPSTDEIADFTINSGSIKWFTIYDLSQDQVYHLRRSDGTLIESSTALNGIVNFTMTGGLSTGTYYVDIPLVITDVNHDTPTNDSVNITWETNKNSDSLVEYGTTSGNYPSNTYDQEMVTSHSIELNGLSSGITYYFIVTSTDFDNDLAQSDEYFFTTASIATPPMLSQPEDQTIEQGSEYEITWMINGIDPGQYRVLRDGTEVVVPTDYQCDGDIITIQVDTSTLGIWNYTIFANDTSDNTVTDQVNIAIQDTTLPVIITATANPTVIEANGTQCTILNVTAIDIGSGIASVTVNLSAIGGFPVQVMTLDNGIWQFIAYTKIIGTFRLPVNVTDKVALSNTSVDISLNAVDTMLPLINRPEDQLIEQSIKGNIIWTITDAEPHMYWVLRNGIEIVPPSYYQSGVNITVLIEDTLSSGVWNYTIFANDTLEHTASNQVIITVQETKPPAINHPNDQTIERCTTGSITWIITDETPEKYWVLRNGIQIISPTDFDSGDTINISVDNTLTVGVWNYTIFANDTSGNMTNSDQVNITVEENIPITISIASPCDGYYTALMSIVVTGYVDGNGSVPRVVVNGVEAEIDLVGFAGDYNATVPLNVGTNSITVTAYTINEDISDLVKVFRKKVLTSSPNISNITNTTPTTDSVTISWDTDEDSDSLVKYGTESGSYKVDVPDSALVSSHSIELSRLNPNTTYYYVVNSTDAGNNSAQSDEYNFTSTYIATPLVISQPEDQEIKQGSAYKITWMINGTDPGQYRVLRNGTEVVVPTDYQCDGDFITIQVDTSTLGIWNYTIFANDTSGNTVTDQVNITVEENISITISIASPYDGYYTTSMSIVVTGYVDGNGSVPTVVVNEVEAEIDLVGFAGNYTATVPLNVGTNSITVIAYNTMNEEISDLVKVFRKKVSTSRSKSGGGGGGGAAGEDFNNIMISETQREFVCIGEDISYVFDSEDNIVRYINFTGYKTAGTIPAKVDMLNHTSSLVNYAPLDIVYKNLNIWVGNKGWANSKNIGNATISFNLEKSWINENNIDRSTIKMKRYYNGKWNILETTLIDQDVKYLYFESKIAGFSSFVITGKQRYTVEPDEPGEEGIEDDKPVAVVTETLNNTSVEAPTGDEIGIPGFGLFICLVVGLMVIWKIRKE
jgi:PGF-pre-PGF domain-containing protein